MIAVCGATGTIGKRVVSGLVECGKQVRALSRSLRTSVDPLVEFVAMDMQAKDSITTAIKGAEGLFLICPIGAAQFELEKNLVEAAASAGVRRIVKLSVMGAQSDSTIEFGRIHGRIEQVVRESGCLWTFLRPNMFMQNLSWYRDAIEQGTLPLPLGSAAVSHVDALDIAEVAVKVLLDANHNGKTYTVTGPEALTGTQVAAILAAALHQAVDYRPVSTHDFRAYLNAAGESEMVVDAELELFAAWSEGQGSAITSDVEQILGRPATKLADFVAREFRGVVDRSLPAVR